MNFPKFQAYLCKVIKFIATFAKNNNQMTVERDIAGFALPFTAGTAAAVYAGASSGSIFITSAVLTGTLVTLMLPSRKGWSCGTVRTLLCILAVCTGALCGLRAVETPYGPYTADHALSMAERFGQSMTAAADSIQFKDRNTNAFVKAVLTGERDGMSREVTEAFRDSGASHTLALSGLHLGVIYMMIGRLLSVIGHSLAAMRLRALLTVVLCGFYTLATGAGPSITRAFLFILLNETAKAAGRHTSIGNTLMAALIIQLCLSPGSVRSVGFQLSYAAMAGIAFIYPRLKGLWPEKSEGERAGILVTGPARWIWNSAAMSIACQVTTAPLAYLYFGTFPKYFLLTNLIALPLTGILIPLAAVTLGLGMAGICPGLLVRATEWLTGVLTGALGVIASM